MRRCAAPLVDLALSDPQEVGTVLSRQPRKDAQYKAVTEVRGQAQHSLQIQGQFHQPSI
jgi:hypothetical protein